MTTIKPTTMFPCAKCSAPILCWPYRAGKSVCAPCLRKVKSANGRKVSAGQAPALGAVREIVVRGIRYRQVYRPDLDDTTKSGWMMEHRVVMADVLGRRLTPVEVVHHKDHDGTNNDPSNLELCASQGEHLAKHHSLDANASSVASLPRCLDCGARTMHGRSICRECEMKTAVCPTCNRSNVKMAVKTMCNGCYKAHRVKLARSRA